VASGCIAGATLSFRGSLHLERKKRKRKRKRKREMKRKAKI
jgi:hypothetical protein